MRNARFALLLMAIQFQTAVAFSDTIISRPEHEVAYDIFEFGNFYLIAGIIHVSPEPASYLIKLSKKTGEVIQDTVINPGSRYYKILKIDGEIVLFGHGWSLEDKPCITYTRMDTSLNILQERHLKLPSEVYRVGRFDVIQRSDSILFLAGRAFENDSFPCNTLPILYLFSDEGDSLCARVLKGPMNTMRECNTALQTTYMNCTLVTDLINDHKTNSAIIADNSLEIWDTISFGNDLFRDVTALYLNDTFIMFYRKTRVDRIFLTKFNYQGQQLEHSAVCGIDLYSNPALQNSLDSRDGKLYYLGMRNIQIPGGVWGVGHPSYLIAGCTDLNLNQQWQRELGGDYYYLPFCIKATTDGGCVLTGILNDTINHNFKSDIFVIKLDSAGQTAFINNITPKVHLVDIFPNPCTQYLKIISTIPGEPIREIIVFGIDGRIIDKQDVNSSEVSLNTSSYMPGSYLLYGKTASGLPFKQKFIHLQ